MLFLIVSPVISGNIIPNMLNPSLSLPILTRNPYRAGQTLFCQLNTPQPNKLIERRNFNISNKSQRPSGPGS